MYADVAIELEDLFELALDGDEIVTNFRDRYGDYRLGRMEEDPEMSEYEEIVDLGSSLSSYRD
jgi:hypothetical protein